MIRTFHIGFSIEGPSQAKIDCQDNGDGSADVRYLPTVPGEYAVHILCDDEDIPGSPYVAQVLPKGDFHPDLVSPFCFECPIWMYLLCYSLHSFL